MTGSQRRAEYYATANIVIQSRARRCISNQGAWLAIPCSRPEHKPENILNHADYEMIRKWIARTFSVAAGHLRIRLEGILDGLPLLTEDSEEDRT